MTRRIAFLIGLLVQLLCVFGLFLPSLRVLTSGTPATLLSLPVDPWSLTRGQYVALDYQAAQGITVAGERRLYVTLEQKGDVFERVAVSPQRPALKPGQICLWAVNEGWRVRFPDIAQYFVQEGSGQDLEQAARARRLYVDIAADSSCRSRIRGVRIGQALSDQELEQLNRERFPIIPPGETKPVPAPSPVTQ